MDQDQQTKVLGMRWSTKSDTITYKKRELALTDDILTTKREILKESSTIFDPLGILSPVTVKCKMFMQSLWEKKFDWDEILPQEVISEWKKIRSDIEKCIETEIPRCYFTNPTPKDRTLHIFTDASFKAYGACTYLVSGNESKLVMARNRVAPLKQHTIPKLELTAAVIGARLCDYITSSIYCKRVILWRDSQIVLKWLCSPKSQKPFVGNSDKEIMALTNSHEWRYCPTESNPADLLSRGISFGKFKYNTLWMNGPSWLLHEENFPVGEDPLATFVTSITDTCEAVAGTVSAEEHNANGLTSGNVADIFNVNRFSSYKRILHVTAYVLRFISNCRSTHKVHGMLNSLEIDSASRVLIAHAQKKNYPDIIKYFEKNCRQTKPNLIRQLDLFMDEDRIIRCGGRIGNAALHEKINLQTLSFQMHMFLAYTQV
ncbi:uncharacterized protein LOC123537977 [Mercenaria mercenaria]|uniref:uncharacterized protein LOC123537977 n=1 Tax=Mercenaria mercenaria TaxID=6596 RepID=UPI00234E8BBC|nr:uncharacterized protein LOC123537977 [Mercenaria mercenaria]